MIPDLHTTANTELRKHAHSLQQYYNESQAYAEAMRSHDSAYFVSYVRLVEKFAIGCERLLEIGCGPGVSTREIARVLPEVRCIGTDISHSAIAFASQNYLAPNLEFAVADLRELPYPDGYFSVITSFDCLEHVPELEKALYELMRVVRPGGRIIIKAPNHMSPLTTMADIFTLRHRYPFTVNWSDNFRRLIFEFRHFLAGLNGAVEFIPNTPDLSETVQVGGDADAVTDMSTVSFRNFFRREGWIVLSTGWPRRQGLLGALVARLCPLWASMGIVVQRPTPP